jgi:hypothetical protein
LGDVEAFPLIVEGELKLALELLWGFVCWREELEIVVEVFWKG